MWMFARNMKTEPTTTALFAQEDGGACPLEPKIEIDVDASEDFNYYANDIRKLDRKLIKQHGIRQCFVDLTYGEKRNVGEAEYKTSSKISGSKIKNGLDDVDVKRDNAIIADIDTKRPSLKFDTTKTEHHIPKQWSVRDPFGSDLQCSVCFQTFKARKLLREHVTQIHGNRVHHCEFCDKWFADRLQYNNHVNIHLNIRPFKCSTCSRTFTSQKNFHRHFKTHTGEPERKYACAQCPKCFKTGRSLENHNRMHNNDRACKCPDCPKTYKYDAQLRIHRRLHTGQRFYCEVCKKPFIDKADLKKHVVIHSDARPFRCDTCGSSFKRKGNLNSHLLTHADLFNIAKETCKMCGHKFRDMKKHMLIHDPNRPIFKCHFCGEDFNSKASRLKHIRDTCRHLKHSDYLCDVCGKALKTKCNLYKHRKQHTHCDRHQCKKCDKFYTYRHQLHRHVRRTHDHIKETNRGTKCNFCSNCVVNMDKHVAKHHADSNSHKIECSTCGKIIKGKHNIKLHEIRHQGVRPFRCDHCQQTFVLKGDLKRHIICRHIAKVKPSAALRAA